MPHWFKRVFHRPRHAVLSDFAIAERALVRRNLVNF